MSGIDATDADQRLLVVGAGTMGHQIALQAMTNGVEVALVDASGDQLRRAREQIDSLLGSRVAKGRISARQAAVVRARLELSGSLAAVAPGCAWLIEAVPERLELKRAVLNDAAALMPRDAGLATNSSHLRAATLAEGASWARRCMNMHFFHPVLVMDLVEVVAGPLTKPEYLDAAVLWARRIGRRPIRLTQDVDGFLVNRILGQASREAFSLLSSGVAGFEDIDIAVRHGLRWPLGPFQLADLSGLDVLCDARRHRYEQHGDEADLCTVRMLEPLVEAGRLGRKAGQGFYDYTVDPPQALPLPGIVKR